MRHVQILFKKVLSQDSYYHDYEIGISSNCKFAYIKEGENLCILSFIINKITSFVRGDTNVHQYKLFLFLDFDLFFTNRNFLSILGFNLRNIHNRNHLSNSIISKSLLFCQEDNVNFVYSCSTDLNGRVLLFVLSSVVLFISLLDWGTTSESALTIKKIATINFKSQIQQLQNFALLECFMILFETVFTPTLHLVKMLSRMYGAYLFQKT